MLLEEARRNLNQKLADAAKAEARFKLASYKWEKAMGLKPSMFWLNVAAHDIARSLYHNYRAKGLTIPYPDYRNYGIGDPNDSKS